MKQFILIKLMSLLFITSSFSQSITDIVCTAQPLYGYLKDGKPGRELLIAFKGGPLKKPATVWVNGPGVKETIQLTASAAGDTLKTILLPPGLGVDTSAEISVTFKYGGTTIEKKVHIPRMRHWTIFIYPHSHVDIGYTNTQKNVEILHRTNVIEGMKLAKLTKEFPGGAKYKWNPEVSWPVERLWNAQPQERTNIINAIKNNQLRLDAAYLHANTSIATDEELFHNFRFSRYLQQQTGKKSDVFMQVDIPGITWGLVPVMVQEGIRYVVSWINGGDRVGNAHRFGINGYPFWWIGPDGKSKVLFFQPGNYTNRHSVDKGGKTGRPWFGQRDASKVPAVIKTGYSNVDFTAELMHLEQERYPYDFLARSWTLWDNTPLDADVPYAVKEWNTKYAYPKIVITGAGEMMQHIEKKYGDQLPEVKGDYTEYWTDGLGTAANLTAMNRNSKELLTQAEKLWTMLNNHRFIPRDELDEAWRYIALGSEHTWSFENPSEPFFQDAIFGVKSGYFNTAKERSREAYDAALAPITDKSNGGLGPLEGPAAGGVAVINTNSWSHGGLVTLSKAESILGDRVIDEKEVEVPAQRLSTGELVFWVNEVPALGSRHYRVTKGKSEVKQGCSIENYTMQNGRLKVVIDAASGNIAQLVNLETGYNYADKKVNGGLNAFRWLPGNVDAPVADSVMQIRVVEKGPLLIELEVMSKGKGVRSVSRSVRLVWGQPWLDLSNKVDKLPLVEKDGIHFGFGFNIAGGRTRVDIPWGVIEVEKDQWPQANRNWLTLQRWLDISNDQVGVTWCSLDAPLFEYGKMSANNARGWGNGGHWIEKVEPSSTIYSWVMNNHWHTNFPLTQDGSTAFRYRIKPHNGYDASEANRFGMEQSQPLVHVAANMDPDIKPFVRLDNNKVVVSILKATGNGKAFIIRLRSLSQKEENVQLRFLKQPRAVQVCDVEEKPSKPVSGAIKMLPWGMTTIRVEL